MHALGVQVALTTARVSQLLALLDLPEEIITFIESLADRHLGLRYLTEHRVREWAVLPTPEEQVAAFRGWVENKRR